eukprot:4288320-Amphidinium_carterae.1
MVCWSSMSSSSYGHAFAQSSFWQRHIKYFFLFQLASVGSAFYVKHTFASEGTLKTETLVSQRQVETTGSPPLKLPQQSVTKAVGVKRSQTHKSIAMESTEMILLLFEQH